VTFTATVAAVAPGTTMPTGTVQFLVDGTAVGSAVTLVNGIATSAAVSNLSVGNHSVTASYTSNSTNVSNSATSSAFTQQISGQPTLLAFVQQPTSTGVGSAISPAVTVAVEDQAGDTYTADNISTVTLTLSSGTFSNGNSTASATVSGGIATFGTLTINAANSYTLTASDAALTHATSNTFTIATLGTAVKLGFIQQPTNLQTGYYMTPSVTVAVEDSSGHTVTTDSSSVITLTLSDGTVLESETVSNGIGTFPYIYSYDSAGNYTIKATDGTLNAATSSSFVLTDPPSYLNFNQYPNNTNAGVAMSPGVSVAVIGNSGNTVTTDSSTVTLTLSSGTFSNGQTTATAVASGGVATFNNLVINTPGAYALTASDGTLYGTTSNTFDITIPATTTIDDNVVGTGVNKINYVGSGWGVTNSSIPGVYGPTLTNDNLKGDTASMSFNGAQVLLYSATKNNRGHATVTIDAGLPGAITQDVDMYANSSTGFGDVLVYTSPVLTPGPHTITVTNAGVKDAASSDIVISIDRMDVVRATPTITWANPADIPFGTLLSSTQLNATAAFNGATVPGTFVYSPPAGTQLSGGQNSLSVLFIPTDTTDYATNTAAANINIIIPPTTTTVTSSVNPSVAGQGVTFTATVTTPPGNGTPDGYVYFYVDNNYYDFEYLNGSGVATSVPDTALSVGPHQITTYYYSSSGGFADNDTTANPFTQTVVASTPTKLGFTQSLLGSTAGVAMSPAVTVAVEDQGGNVVTGNSSTVTLTLSHGTFAGTGNTVTAVASGGIATFGNLTINATGNYTLTATDGNLASAASSPFLIYPASALTTIDDTVKGSGIDQILYTGAWTTSNPTTLLNCYDNTTTIDGTAGDSATVTFTGTQIIYYAGVKNTRGIAAVSLDGGTPANVDEFAADSTGYGNVVEYVSPILAPGTHTLKISVTGNTDGNPADAGTIVSLDRFDIIKATPALSWSAPAAITYGTALGATQLNPSSSVQGTFAYAQPSGTVLSAGQNQTLSATFTPTDSNDYSTANVTTSINVNPAGTTTTVSSNATPAVLGQPVAFTATVANTGPGAQIPTGTVQFQIDGANLGTPLALVGGSVTCTAISSLTAGTHTITAVYAPATGNFSTSTSNAFSQTVLPGWLTATAGAKIVWNQAGETLQVNSGTATIIADPGEAQFNSGAGDSPVITVAGIGTSLIVAPTDGSLIVHVGGLSLQSSGTADVSSLGAARTHSNHRVLVIGKVNQATAPIFSIDNTNGSLSTLNLEDNDMIVHGGNDGASDLAAVQAAAAIGRNVAPGGIFNGTWTGNGLTSSVAAAVDAAPSVKSEQNILAVELNSDRFLGKLSTWTVGSAGEPLRADGNDVLVKYTYDGDLNLSGAVDDNAVTILGNYYALGVPLTSQTNVLTQKKYNADYALGDLNGDGLVDNNDVTILGNFYGDGTPGNALPQL
jgi:hypothetical protein